MNKPIIGLLLLLMSGLASAACPDIQGTWGYQLSQTVAGEENVGIGRGKFRSNGTWNAELYLAALGWGETGTIRGEYTSAGGCIIEGYYEVDDSDDGKGSNVQGDMASIIINEDKMYMILVDSDGFFNAKVVAERLQ